MTAGLSTNAYAVCTHPKAATEASPNACGGGPGSPPPPHSIYGTLDNATVGGTAYPSSQSVSSDTTFASGTSLTGVQTANNGNTVKVWLKHTYVKATRYVQSGSPYLQLHISTQSNYAPDGDSGTFVFDSNGALVSGSQSALSRIQGEVQAADSSEIEQTQGLWGWITSHASQIEACGEFAGGVVVGVAGIAGGVATGGAVGVLIAGGGLIGGAGMMVKTATKCF
jgi:hypothetical protein